MSWFIEIFNAPARDSLGFMQKLYYICVVTGSMVFLSLILAVLGVGVLFLATHPWGQTVVLDARAVFFLAVCCLGEMLCVWLLFRARRF